MAYLRHVQLFCYLRKTSLEKIKSYKYYNSIGMAGSIRNKKKR